MANDSKRRKKHERRQKRLERRHAKSAEYKQKLLGVTCPNCGDLFGLPHDPDVVHRPGPCDATPAIVSEMKRFLDARAEAYESAPNGKIECPTCGTLHGEDQQATHFFEGRLVWNGCEACFAAQSVAFEQIRDEHYVRWFGRKRETVRSKYAPPVLSFAAPTASQP